MDKHKYLSQFLKENFGGKVAKISIDGGFTCPNRIAGGEGCLFCTEKGAGEFSGDSGKSISCQIAEGRAIMDKKWKNIGYIAYFQNYTNTYSDVRRLKKLYDEALSCEKVLGLAIATRPDCLGNDVLDLLDYYNKKTFLWIELGLQTSNPNTADIINRGYDNDVFEDSIHKLHKLGIRTVVHLIGGLPGEKKKQFLESVHYINKIRPWGIKFHSIYIQKNSPLYQFSDQTGFEPLEMHEYIDWVTDGLMILNKKVIVHRLTGDPDKKLLVKPMWQKDKLKVLSEIKRIFELKNKIKSRS